MADNKEDFDVNIPEKQSVEDVVETSYAKKKQEAVALYDPKNRPYSTYLEDTGTVSGLTYADLETYSESPQSDLNKTLQIIRINRQYANKNDIVGITVETIENNINTDVRLTYKTPKKGVYKREEIDQAKAEIDSFNDRINLSRLINKAVNTAFIDGTFITCMRQVGEGENADYVVDYYPVGSALVSDYEVGGDPYVLIDISELKARLQKTYLKTRKRKGLFFDTMEDEIKANYPPEVYTAYKDKESYAKLNIENTGVIRIGNQNKKYGLSPIFRSIYPILMLEAFDTADRSNARARAKKIIAQVMNKEILGDQYSRDTYEDQAFAHKTLLDAWSQKTVVTTLPPTVRDIKYVEPKVEMTSVETINYYRQRTMATLGISFLADPGSSSFSSTNISVKQLMKRIDKISKQLEDILVKWYRLVLKNAGMDTALAPRIKIIDSEMMEMSMKIDLANLLYSKLNCSLGSALNLLGYDLDDEKIRREAENKDGIDQIFSPRITAYTASGSSSSNGGSVTGGTRGGLSDGTTNNGGRPPASEDDSRSLEKQAYDQQNYKSKNEYSASMG